MSRFTKFLMLVVLLFTIDAAFTTLSASKRTPKKFSVLHYINTYKNIAVKEMQRTKIPASITLAQGILESTYGNSYLARNANNHFGIKCHNGWSGKKAYATDDEENECFRKYVTGGTSYRDHSNFLKNNSRYSFLFRYKKSDYRSWATGLGKAGYATNSKYGSHLIRIIERYQLHTFDRTPEEIQQDKLDRIMRDYQLRLKGMMNHEDLYPTWFINDRPSQPSLLSSIKRRTPMMTTTYGWSEDKTKMASKTKKAPASKTIAKAKAKPKTPAKSKPKTMASKAVKKPVITKKKAAPVIAKKTSPKPPVAKAVTKPTQKKKAIAVATPPKTTVVTKPKATPKPQKSIAAAKKPKPAAKTSVAKAEKKLSGELFSALNNWKKKTTTAKKETAVAKKEASKPAATSKVTHTVKKGDTLYSLSRKYNTKVEQIKKANGLSDNALKLGARLVIEP